MDIRNLLIESIRQADRKGAQELLDGWAAEQGLVFMFSQVLEPVLLQIGEEWKSEESFTIAQAYVAAKITEDVLTKMAANESTTLRNDYGPVILGNIEDDFHALGRKMVATFLRAKGWTVHDLGNDVPPVVFVEQAMAVGARVMGVSAMMLSTAQNILKLREEIDKRHLTGRLQLAVGGAIFIARPELVTVVGGDGTSKSAIKADDLFIDLWNKSLKECP